ncbi:hypothetical protein HYU14_05400 [Candidatus Woesearchaeota archaeon]|nr:hypothetical protein [Candidatus Woesearchaeota archaeon]
MAAHQKYFLLKFFLAVSILFILSGIIFALSDTGIAQQGVTEESQQDWHCNNLPGSVKAHCESFNAIDGRLAGANWYLGKNNSHGSIAWTRSPLVNGYAIMYRVTNDTYYLDKAITQIDDILALRDDNRGFLDYTNRSLAGWSATNYSNTSLGLRFAVHSGVIIYPMLDIARSVLQKSGMQEFYTQKALEYIEEAKKVADAHEEEWVNGPDTRVSGSEGYYQFPPDFPADRPGMNLPNNQQLAMGSSLLLLYNLTGNGTFLDKAERMGMMLKNDLNKSNGTFNWHYWPGKEGINVTKNRPEDIGHGHGGIDINFAYDAWAQGVLFNDTEMGIFASTFTSKIFNGNLNNISFRVNGSTTVNTTDYKNIGRWLYLTPFDAEVYRIIEKIYAFNNFSLTANRNALEGYAMLAEFWPGNSPRSFNLSLQKGWSLFSVPLALNSTSHGLSQLLQQGLILSFNNTGKKFYRASEIKAGEAYITKSAQEIIIPLQGAGNENAVLNITPGISLIGFPFSEAINASDFVETILGDENVSLYAFNQTWLVYNPQAGMAGQSLKVLKPGSAYWARKR